MLNQADRNILFQLKRRLQEIAGDRLQAVIAYGSRARGEAGPDSDLDIAVIVEGKTPELEAACGEAVYQIMWDHDFAPFISMHIFEAGKFNTFQQAGYSFYRRVAQEGIAV